MNNGVDFRRRRSDDRTNPATFVAAHPMQRARFRQWTKAESDVARALDLTGGPSSVEDIEWTLRHGDVWNPPDAPLIAMVLTQLQGEGIVKVDDDGKFWFA